MDYETFARSLVTFLCDLNHLVQYDKFCYFFVEI